MTDREQDDSRASDAFMRQWLEQQQQFWRHFTRSADVASAAGDSGDPDFNAAYWADALTEQQSQLQALGESLLQIMQKAQQDQAAQAGNRQATRASANSEHLAKVFIEHLQQISRQQTLDQCQLPPQLAEWVKQFQASAVGLDSLSLSRFPFLLQTLGRRQQHYQQQSQALLQGWQDFLHAYQRYHDYESELLQACAAAFTEQLKSRAESSCEHTAGEDSAAIKQLADVFTLWAECYDSEHQHQNADSDYRHAYGDLLNTSLALRQAAQAFIHAEDYRMLGLVPRQDYLELLQQHHQLRKDLRRIQRQHQQQISELEQRISVLERPASSKKRSHQQSTKQQSTKQQSTKQQST